MRKQNKNLMVGGVVGHDGSNAGRPPEWLKEKCRDIVDKNKLIDFLGDVAKGEALDERTQLNGDGDVVKIKCAASIKDRERATEILLDRGWGKPTQEIDAGSNLIEMLREKIMERYK